MSDVTRIVVCDDQGMVRAGFKSLLEAEPDLEVVGEASNGQEAIDIVTLLQPDVTLMDIRMPVLDGLAATRHLVEAGVPTSVLVLTTFDLDEYVFEALRAGASGFLLKDAPAEELAAAIRVVAAGDSLLAPGVTRRVIDAFVRRADAVDPPGRPAARPAHARASSRCSGLLARGLSNLDIGRRLFVSEGTTKTHVSNVLTKLGLRDRVQAVIFAYENGVVVPGDVPKISRSAEGRTRRATDPRRGLLGGRSSHDDDHHTPEPRHHHDAVRGAPLLGRHRPPYLPGRGSGARRGLHHRGRRRRPGRRHQRQRDARRSTSRTRARCSGSPPATTGRTPSGSCPRSWAPAWSAARAAGSPTWPHCSRSPAWSPCRGC